MPLPKAWRFIVYNRDTGQQLDFSSNSANEKATVTFVRHYIDASTASSVKASHSSETTHSAGTDLADGATETLTNVTGEDRLGMTGYFEVETDNASASGNVDLLMEWSTDGGTTWPSDAANWNPDNDARLVATVNLSGAETVATNFQVGD